MQVLHVLDPPLKSEDEGEEGATAQSNHSSIPVGPEHAELGERAKAGASLPQGGSGLGWGYTKCPGGRCGPSKPGRHSLSGNDHTENCLISLCSLQARTSSEQNATECIRGVACVLISHLPLHFKAKQTSLRPTDCNAPVGTCARAPLASAHTTLQKIRCPMHTENKQKHHPCFHNFHDFPNLVLFPSCPLRIGCW